MENKRPFKTIYTCFPQGKHKVLTISYDDGKIFDRKLIEIFNKYGIKGTFHLNTGIMPVDEDRIQLSEVKELYKGHEVSCHTSTHPTIERCPLDQVVQQVIEDRKALEDAVGYPVRGLSYPNGSYSKDIINLLPACGIEYSRVVGSTDDFAFPDNFLEWIYYLNTGEIPSTATAPGLEEAREKLKLDSMTKDELAAYYSHLDNLIILRDNIHTEREEGRAEGLVKGREEEKRENARNLKRLGVLSDIISQATGLSKNEIEEL